MLNKNKKATILIYTIVLTSLALTLGIIVMNNASILILNQKNNLLNTQLNNNINSKVNIFLKTIKEKNSDGGGFVDNLEGSGSNIYCREQADGTYLLEGDEGTKSGNDGIDDNCNSDNYLGSNDNPIHPYPNNFEDNDNFSRKNINGLIVPNNTQNIFWNNNLIEKFIEKNINNKNNTKNVLLGEVENGKIYLNIDNEAELKIIEYDKDKYSNFREIKKVATYTGTINGNGYIEKIGNNLSINNNITINSYNFDFKNKGYLIYLINHSKNNYINYNLSAKEDSGKSIFLNPIDDSYSSSIKFLGYDSIISKEGYISTKIRKINGLK